MDVVRDFRVPIAGILVGTFLSFAPVPVWGQIPGRSFRSTIPSRVVPAENVVPVEDSWQQPTPASEPEPTPAERPAPRVLDTVPLSGEGQPLHADPPRGLRQGDAIEASEIRNRRRIQASDLFADAPASPTKGDSGAIAPASKATEPSTAEGESSGSGEAPGEEVTNLVRGEAKQLWQKVLDVWKYKFYESSDKKVSLSLQVIVVGLLLIWLGHILARRLSAWLSGSVFRRLGLLPATAAPLQKVAYYAMFGVFALSSMNTVGLSLDALTFLGGALAIGIGFGSQNVMNNFISGLILLIERPIRVGDVIQINSHSGKVSEIGARSTRITTGSNLEVIIPNSVILQESVVNWTLSDDTISSKITVGVAYGSPAREVARLLKQAADANEEILKSPPPGVSFTEFAADAMQFELTFWVKMSRADRGKVESDLRFMIDELFGKRGIVIAYPQRDVHLNLLRPVEVRLSESAAPQRELRELRGAA